MSSSSHWPSLIITVWLIDVWNVTIWTPGEYWTKSQEFQLCSCVMLRRAEMMTYTGRVILRSWRHFTSGNFLTMIHWDGLELEPDKRIGTRICLSWAQFRLGLYNKVFSRAVACVCGWFASGKWGKDERRAKDWRWSSTQQHSARD
jgi:hypothetical protein